MMTSRRIAILSAAALMLVPAVARAQTEQPAAADLKAVIAATQQAFSENPEMARATFKASATNIEGLRTEAAMRQHGVVADFTEALGGTDAGAGPVELLLAAVGTCQAMTYRAFATALDIPVGAITVEVEGDMDLRGFLAVDDTVRPGFSALRIMVHMVSAAPAEALDGLGQAANAHCPLLDIVTNGVPVEVTLTHDAP